MKNIESLHPELRKKALKLVELAKSKLNLRVIITQTLRTDAEQSALYAQGRSLMMEVNRLRANVGLGPISVNENRHTVTNARTAADSFHGYGLAFDIAITDPTGKMINWNKSDQNANKIDDWAEVGKLAEECGLEWGGNFSSIYDAPHYQDRRGFTIRDLKKNFRSGKTIEVP